jgi:hypothetical protein
MKELHAVRNFHAGFRHGRWLGMVNAGLQFVTGGKSWDSLIARVLNRDTLRSASFQTTAMRATTTSSVTVI